MKRLTSWVASLSLITAVAGTAADTLSESKIVQRLRDATRGGTPGVAILVARNGQIVFQDGFGFADVAHQAPISVATKFRIGSITKQFTAAAVLRLAEQGKLSLDDPLAKYFPDFPHGDQITLRHLLTHTSGIHSYTEKPGFMSRVTSPIDPEKLIEWFRNDPPDFAPGTKFRYDNSGYFLLGEIVAKVSGKPYGDFLREAFFEPLGMKDTGVYSNAAPPPGMALGYSVTNGKAEPALDWDMSWAGGAGSLYSTVGDLFRWNEAFFGGRVVNAASFSAATTPVELPADADGMKYGFGQLVFTVKGLPAIGHGGGLNGWLGDLLRLPEQNCTVVALANAMPSMPEVNPAEITRSLAGQLLADEIEKVPVPTADAALDPKTLGDYAGQYDYRMGIMAVTVEGDALFGRLTGQPRLRLWPKARDEFFPKEADAQLTFLRNEQGQVVAIRHAQNGQVFRAAKLGEPAVSLTPGQLDAIVGQYQYGPNAILTVTRDGTQLFAQLTGQPRFPIFAKGADEFEWHVVLAAVKFVTEEGGKVTKAIHTQNGTTFEAPKIK